MQVTKPSSASNSIQRPSIVQYSESDFSPFLARTAKGELSADRILDANFHVLESSLQTRSTALCALLTLFRRLLAQRARCVLLAAVASTSKSGRKKRQPAVLPCRLRAVLPCRQMCLRCGCRPLVELKTARHLVWVGFALALCGYTVYSIMCVVALLSRSVLRSCASVWQPRD